jgi:cellulose synthase operon protein C
MTGATKKTRGRPKDKVQADANLKRSWEMAAAGLFKEAAVLWEHAARLSPTPLDVAPFLVWLVNSQQMGQAAKLFFDQQAEIQAQHPKLAKNINTLLAAHLLINSAPVKKTVPDRHPLLHELKCAKACLNALCNGDHGRLKKQLAKLPAESAFMEFANIIKSLATAQDKPEAMLAAIVKIPAHSPFANLARVAGIRTLSGSALARALMQIPEADQHLLAQIMGISEALLKLLTQLKTARKSSQTIKILLNHPDPLPGPWVRAAYMDLLVDNLGNRSAVEKHIGPFSKLETCRLMALHHQRKKHRVRTNTHWKRYLKLVEDEPKSPIRSMTLAQIHNHFATLEESAHWPSRVHIIEHLQEAQNHDPEDSETLSRLIHWLRQDEDQTGLQRLITKALKRFPAEPNILMIASEVAYGKKSFKKAAGLAKKAHKLAPHDTNTLDQQLKSQMHHARSQIKAGHLELAHRELAAAQKCAGTTHQMAGEIYIIQALLAALADNAKTASELLQAGEKLTGPSAYYHLYLLLEAGHMGVDKKCVETYLNRPEQEGNFTPSKIETYKIFALIKHHFDRKNPMLAKALNQLGSYLQEASRQDFSKNELNAICNDLFHIRQFALLDTFAKAGEKRWKGETAFLFYRIYAGSGGETYRISDEDFFALREALPTAVRRGDDLTAQRIDTLMGQSPSGSRRNLGALSPAKIPKLLEKQLVRSLKKLIDAEFGKSRKSMGEIPLRNLLLERLAESEYASRGPFILTYLIDKALNMEEGPTARRKKKSTAPTRQLEMDLFE